MADEESSDIRITLTASQRAALAKKAEKEGKDADAFAKGLVIHACTKERRPPKDSGPTNDQTGSQALPKKRKPSGHPPPRVVRFNEERVDGELIKELNSETDRGLALVGATIIDNALRALLNSAILAVLEGDIERFSARDNLMVRGNAPLRSFYAKIEMAYAFGAIESNTYQALHLLRDIRNEFAHEVLRSFEQPEMQATVDKMGNFLWTKPRGNSTRERFEYCIATIQHRLTALIDARVVRLDETSSPTVFDWLWAALVKHTKESSPDNRG